MQFFNKVIWYLELEEFLTWSILAVCFKKYVTYLKLIVLLRSSLPLLLFCVIFFFPLLRGWCEKLQLCIVYLFLLCRFLLTETQLLGVSIFRIIRYSWWIDPCTIIKYVFYFVSQYSFYWDLFCLILIVASVFSSL